jgi:hypothetical protein
MLAVPPPPATSTLAYFTAKPTTVVPLSVVTFAGSVNNTKLCTAQTYSLGYGDLSTSTISVTLNLCKAKTFSFTHSYSKIGTYTTALYIGTGKSMQRLQTQVITVKTTLSAVEKTSNTANVILSIKTQLGGAIKNLLHFFGSSSN